MATAEGRLLRWNEVAANNSAAKQVDISVLSTAYSPILYRVAFSVLRNAVDAEDVVQETFLRVLRHKTS
jgi:RNA polymerase sigma-70 factor (ECF subfamily)